MKDRPEVQVIPGIPVNPAMRARMGLVRYVEPEGAVVVTCEICAAGMWIGPRQNKHRLEHADDSLVACVPCLVLSGLMTSESKVQHLNGPGGSYELASGQKFGPKA